MSPNIYFIIVLLPLFTATIGGLFAYRLGDEKVMQLTSFGVTISAVLSLIGFIQIAFVGSPIIDATLYNWIETTNLSVNFGVYVDKLTATMLLVITSVSACVHWYSIGYMHEDKSKARFFSYLSFFTFAMLALVTAPNLLQMFLGWEGVGLASYLLIGFWYEKKSANAAAVKAFIVNRVADVAMLIAIFTTLYVFGTLEYTAIFTALEFENVASLQFTFFGYEFHTISLIAFLLLIGAMGKSAQIGFHTWLPDAMEGPTPVSALIHAATMVTAGVFLLARMSPLFEMSYGVLEIVAWVGALTAFFAATIGLVQKDIKRVIAYSTCSQLGYMFFACGVSAYSAAIFHLTTHAFFKALLFLAAGSVIHGMHHEQNMFKMGALRKLLPVTYILMWIGSLALAGIPPFAGFFSKDLILESAWMSASPSGQALYVVGTMAAMMTAFYSIRLLGLTFYGKPKASTETMKHVHEAPITMLLPMLLLGVGAVVAGFILSPMGNVGWWQGAIVGFDIYQLETHVSPVVKYTPLVLVVITALFGAMIYMKKTSIAKKIAKSCQFIYTLIFNKWFIDEIYNKIIVRPLFKISTWLWKIGDEKLVDRFIPRGASWLVLAVGTKIRILQSGYVYHYIFIFIVGVVAIMSWFIW